MKIAFPTQEGNGLESAVYNHFGSAKGFIIVDSENDSFNLAFNQDLDHKHNHCQPLKALGGNSVDAVVVAGIGGGALKKLMAADIKVYKAEEGSVSHNLAKFKAGQLPEFEFKDTCGGHGLGSESGCHHH